MPPDTTTAIRARLMAAMEQRGAALDGTARHTLQARLAELRALAADAPAQAPDTAPAPPAPGPLRELLDHLAREDTPARTTYPDVPALADFRQLWSALRTDSQLRQSVAHVPTDAGPLNSTALASRAIALMRELSPDYLRPFLAYVDDLAWLEQLNGTGTVTASGTGAPRKRVRHKPQK
jgi:hypothetical protein